MVSRWLNLNFFLTKMKDLAVYLFNTWTSNQANNTKMTIYGFLLIYHQLAFGQ